jgi:hypothetical protein
MYYDMSDSPVAPTKPVTDIYACIAKETSTTWCGRIVSHDEFTFSSSGAEYAAVEYDARRRKLKPRQLRACVLCIDRIAPMNPADQKPMSTR